MQKVFGPNQFFLREDPLRRFFWSIHLSRDLFSLVLSGVVRICDRFLVYDFSFQYSLFFCEQFFIRYV